MPDIHSQASVKQTIVSIVQEMLIEILGSFKHSLLFTSCSLFERTNVVYVMMFSPLFHEVSTWATTFHGQRFVFVKCAFAVKLQILHLKSDILDEIVIKYGIEKSCKIMFLSFNVTK